MGGTPVGAENVDTAADLVLPTAPVLTAAVPRSPLTVLVPAVMLVGTVGFVVIGGGSTASLMMGGLMAVSLVGMILGGGGRQAKPAATVAAERDRFLRALAEVRRQLIDREAAVRRRAHRRCPRPVDLLSRTGDRTPGASALVAGSVRLGVGSVPSTVRLVAGEATETDAVSEPFAAAVRQRMQVAHRRTVGMPLTVDLGTRRRLRLVGPAAVGLGRSVVLQLCAAQPARTCRVVVWAAPNALRDWEWVKWLPHNGHPVHRDVLGPVRMISGDVADILSWGSDVDPGIRWVLVVVGRSSAATEALRRDVTFGADAVVVEVAPLDVPVGGTDGWEVTTSSLRRLSPAGSATTGVPDLVGAATATAIARRLAGRDESTAIPAGGENAAAGTGLADLLGFGAAGDFRPERHQRSVSGPDRLRVPIGVDRSGAPVLLDLKQAAEGGVGPHGLVIGATGSGKSELLRTLVLALAATHPSRLLNFVLVDFKGGAGFLGLRDLPHVAAVITNLDDEQVLVERMRDALSGEIARRQTLLRAAGALSSAAEYELARSRTPGLPPMPALVIVCDEFTEMLVQQPDLADLFVMIGRLGRSLSIHLLMASQRMEEGRMRGLDAHLSYRVALRTFSAADSRAVLEVDDAYRLPTTPGVGYLKAGSDPVRWFRGAYVSAPPPATPPPARRPHTRPGGPVRLFTSAVVPLPPVDVRSVPVGVSAATPTVLDLWVDRLRGRGAPAHPVWLPPLDAAPLIGDLTAGSAGPRGPRTALRVPVGIVDRPRDQRQDHLWADFTGSTGHGLVVGGARAGKSTLLAVLVLALAAGHRPDEVHCYVIDLGGGLLSALGGLPHVGGVADRSDPDRVRRTVGQLTTLLAERATLTSRRPGADAGRWPDVFLVVDGWAALRADFEDLEAPVTALVQRGLAYGIHVVLSLSRWAEVRPAMKDLMGLRLELRLGDPTESEVDRRAAAAVPTRSPGRGITADAHHFLTAVPGPPGDRDAIDRWVTTQRDTWTGAGAPPVRMLPARVAAADLVAGTHPRAVPIGVRESDLGTVTADFAADPHLVVWGDTGSGRTSFLRTLAAGLVAGAPPTAVRLLVIDHRRGLRGAVPVEYLAGQAGTAAAAAALIDDVAVLMRSRLPVGDLTADELRERSWWSGADLFVLVDDHELVAAAGDPLEPLVDLLPHARDIGLHLVVSRRASGGARAGYEPVLRQLRELGSPGLILSGPPDEGPLHGGQRARALPPGRAFWVTRAGPAQLVQLAMGDG